MDTIKIKSLNNANVDLKSVIIPKEIVIGPTGTLDITENGTYDVETYKYADVDVPQPEGTIEITENATGIDIAQYALANVNVPSGEIKMGTFRLTSDAQIITINHNLGKEPKFFVIGCTYTASTGKTGSGSVSYFYFNIDGNIYSYLPYAYVSLNSLYHNSTPVTKVDGYPSSNNQVHITDNVLELRVSAYLWGRPGGTNYMWFCG